MHLDFTNGVFNISRSANFVDKKRDTFTVDGAEAKGPY
jgi:hypothetical protein